jgi:hypothetical protein
MNKEQLLAIEEEYVTTLRHLEDQENWARAHGHPLLAKALVHGSSHMLSELGVIQKLIQEFKS